VKERGSRINCVRNASIACVRCEALGDTLIPSGGYYAEGTVSESRDAPATVGLPRLSLSTAPVALLLIEGLTDLMGPNSKGLCSTTFSGVC
jgi:hypothetical protein